MNSLSGSRVLFVDDNFICNLETREFLQAQGLIVQPAYCGAAAIEMIHRRDRFAALITDIDLGKGPDGFDVARRARDVHPDLPVIFISSAMGRRVAAEGVPGAEFIAKPFHPSEILEVLETLTRRQAA